MLFARNKNQAKLLSEKWFVEALALNHAEFQKLIRQRLFGQCTKKELAERMRQSGMTRLYVNAFVLQAKFHDQVVAGDKEVEQFHPKSDPKCRSSVYEAYLRSDHWKALRRAAFERDRYKCTSCGSTNDLHGHHVVYRNPLTKCTVEDISTLCESCHDALHKSRKESRRQKRRAKRLKRALKHLLATDLPTQSVGYANPLSP